MNFYHVVAGNAPSFFPSTVLYKIFEKIRLTFFYCRLRLAGSGEGFAHDQREGKSGLGGGGVDSTAHVGYEDVGRFAKW
jgi:hypothetical protein